MVALTEDKSQLLYQSEYETTTLPNGLRIITASMPHTRSAAVQFFIGVGARHEEPRLSGISHFVEHMVFKGTNKRPNPVQISEAIEGVGGSLNAATDHEHTNYRALVPSPYMGTSVDVLTDMLLDSRFTQREIGRERDVIIEEISSTFDSPGDIVDMVFDAMLWGEHPLGRDVAGSRTSVRRIKRDDLLRHVEDYYRPESIVVSIAGKVSHADVVREVEDRWGGVRASMRLRAMQAPEPAPPGPRVKLYKKDTEQSNLIVGVPAVSYTDSRRYTQDVLDVILGSGMSSRLFVQLREERGLAYSVSSFVKNYHDTGAFGVHAAIDNDKVLPALDAIMAELYKISESAVSETELRKVKEYIKGHTLLSLERSGYVAHWAGWQELMLGRIDSVEEALEHIEGVTAQDVLALAQQLFSTDKLHLAVVGPRASTVAYRKALKVG